MSKHPTIREVGAALFGSLWQSELARALAMSPRHMRRLVAGDSEITDDTIKGMAAVARARLKEVERITTRLQDWEEKI